MVNKNICIVFGPNVTLFHYHIFTFFGHFEWFIQLLKWNRSRVEPYVLYKQVRIPSAKADGCFPLADAIHFHKIPIRRTFPKRKSQATNSKARFLFENSTWKILNLKLYLYFSWLDFSVFKSSFVLDLQKSSEFPS